MIRFPLLILFIFCVLTNVNAQVRCASYEVQKQKLETDSGYRVFYDNINRRMDQWSKANTNSRITYDLVTIPVVVHVVYNTEEQNISDAQIESEIDVLNHDYTATNANVVTVPTPFKNLIGDPNLNFCLATRTPAGNYSTGIERRKTSNPEYSIGDPWLKSTSLGGLDAWDRNRYLNIWICNLAGGNILGYTDVINSPPQTDGCVILYSVFGVTGNAYPQYTAYSKGRTATHEIGHWLGLYHIWGDDGMCGVSPHDSCCCWGTDHIDDTPNQGCMDFSCPLYPKLDDCTDTIPGIMFMNYMDYTDDACMSLFSAGQAAVMRSILDTVRSTIKSSTGCQAPGGINEINAASYIDVYPNPANEIVQIGVHLPSLQIIDIGIYDLTGRLIEKSAVHKTGAQTINLNISSLQNGLYTLLVKTDEGDIAKRLAIKK